MASSLIGNYEFESAENLDEYLVALGVGLVLRKVQSVAKPSMEISYSGDTNEWIVKTESPFKTQIQRYKVGNPIEDETYDARKCRTTAKIDGEKFILEQECDEGPKVTVVKQIADNGCLKMTLIAGDFSTTHSFRKK